MTDERSHPTPVLSHPDGPVRMDLSICIVSYNTREVLERTVRAAWADAPRRTAEILVVDNGSRDESVRMLKETFPHVETLVNPDNRFFTAAMNQAFARAKGDFVLALNSDVEIRPGTLPALLDYLKAHPDVGALTTQMFHPDGLLQRTCSRFPSFSFLLLEHTFLGRLFRGIREQARHETWYGDWDRLSQQEVEVAPGSFLLVRRSVLRAVGAFDESFRLYFSDDDWCRRLHSARVRLTYVPSRGVVHPEGTSTRRIQPLAHRIFFEDMLAYAAKYFGRGRAWVLGVLAWPTRWGLALTARMRRG